MNAENNHKLSQEQTLRMARPDGNVVERLKSRLMQQKVISFVLPLSLLLIPLPTARV